MNKIIIYILIFFSASCGSSRTVTLPININAGLSGSEFYNKALSYNWKQRDSLAVQQILSGNVPSFLKKLVPIHTSITDETGKIIKATYYVSPDYLSVGSDQDWARVPLSPKAAQQIADSLNCFLPTRKMVNDIYAAATVKLEPVPMYAFRDSTITMYQHHLIIEGQRKLRKGLVAGIKKDVVISEKVTKDIKTDRVAIYGWHKPDGKAIQPLYNGHVNWYVDYSHGARLVHQTVYVDGKAINYKDILKDKKLKALLCDEEYCNFYAYPY